MLDWPAGSVSGSSESLILSNQRIASTKELDAEVKTQTTYSTF